MEENLIVIGDTKTFCFNFDWARDLDENLKHEIKSIIKSNESLIKNKITSQPVTKIRLKKFK